MTIAEQILAIVESLPPDQAHEILTFAEFVRAQHLGANRSVNPANTVTWAEFVYSLAGAWKDDFPDLGAIRSESGKDSLREIL